MFEDWINGDLNGYDEGNDNEAIYYGYANRNDTDYHDNVHKDDKNVSSSLSLLLSTTHEISDGEKGRPATLIAAMAMLDVHIDTPHGSYF